MKKYQIEKWYTEKISGKNMDRKKLQEMLDFIREGDTVYVYDLSRLARNVKDLLKIIELLQNKNVHLVSAKENINSSTPFGALMITMIGAVAEFERTSLLERQREGIAIAKREGKYKGGKRKQVKGFQEGYTRYKERKVTKTALAQELKISRPTLDKLIREYEEQCKM